MSLLQIVSAAIVVALSAWIQASVGFGYALVSAPLLALVSPPLVPGPIMVSSFVLCLATGWRERQHIDWRGVLVALSARVPGVMLSGLALSVLSLHALNVLFGGLVLLAVALSALGTRLRSSRAPASAGGSVSTPMLVLAAFASGFMGTLTSAGGPPMALVYQRVEGPALRATLNTYFALGSVMSISALVLVGRFGQREWLSGVLLLPAVGIGFALSGVTRSWVDAGRSQRAVLAIAGASALGVVIKTLLG